MASALTHYYLSKKIAEKLNLDEEFIVDTWYPDFISQNSVNPNGIEKAKTHFAKDVEYDNGVIIIPQLNLFLANKDEQLYNGKKFAYCIHLLEDIYWHTFMAKFVRIVRKDKEIVIYLRDNSEHELKEYQSDSYNAYNIVDHYLIENDQIDIEKLKEKCINFFHNVEKIYKSFANELYHQKLTFDHSKFYTREEVDEFLEGTPSKIIEDLKELKIKYKGKYNMDFIP